MRYVSLTLLAVIAMSPVLAAQNPDPPEQSPRQALIEMFMGKGENDFVKHLPDAARAALIRKGESPETSFLLKISAAIRGVTQQGEKVETFDSGPNILVTENAYSQERIEIAVEHDSFSGDEDEIELSVRPYKNGEPEALPVVPRLTFTLKQQNDVWKVTELTLAALVPLEDPDYLKSVRKQQDEVNESAAQMRLNMIAQAETTYASNHADAGYVCQLGSLYPSAENAFAKNEFSGYRFSLTGCNGKPATKYRLTASPIDPDSEMKTFCADESGTLKAAEATDSSSCFSQGKPLNGMTPQPTEPTATSEPGPTD